MRSLVTLETDPLPSTTQGRNAADDSSPTLHMCSCQCASVGKNDCDSPPTTWKVFPSTVPCVLSSPPVAPTIGAPCVQLLLAGSKTLRQGLRLTADDQHLAAEHTDRRVGHAERHVGADTPRIRGSDYR